MALVEHGGITIDRCIHCNGLWFDHLEIEQLQKLKGAGRIDLGASKNGCNYDTIKDISCPRCNRPMLKLNTTGEDPFSYESCSKCNGVFLDAGEFSKLKGTKKSLLDYIKTFLNK